MRNANKVAAGTDLLSFRLSITLTTEVGRMQKLDKVWEANRKWQTNFNFHTGSSQTTSLLLERRNEWGKCQDSQAIRYAAAPHHSAMQGATGNVPQNGCIQGSPVTQLVLWSDLMQPLRAHKIFVLFSFPEIAWAFSSDQFLMLESLFWG